MTPRDQLVSAVAQLRAVYDRADSNVERAQLRRAGSLDEVLASPAFWALVRAATAAATLTSGDSPSARRTRRLLATIVFAFPAARSLDTPERFGTHLRRSLFEPKTDDAVLAKGTPRLRRLLAARDDADLAHQLRRILMLATAKAGGREDPRAAVYFPGLARDLHAGLTQARVRWSEAFFAGDPGDDDTVEPNDADPTPDPAEPTESATR